MLLLCFACPFNHQELVLLEDDMKALEEMYPQGEQAEATWALTVLGYIGKLLFGAVGYV
jgi:LMBR1 domain-containing protein 1